VASLSGYFFLFGLYVSAVDVAVYTVYGGGYFLRWFLDFSYGRDKFCLDGADGDDLCLMVDSATVSWWWVYRYQWN